MSGAPQRLGMYGGAFDPPHNAHLAVAQAALEQAGLDELRIFPTGHAWHKARTLTDAQDRLAMTRLAFAGMPKVVVDDRELRRAGPTYTIDTLRELQAEHAGAQLFLVMGEDQAAALKTWREWEVIVSLATLCLARRAETGADASVPSAPSGSGGAIAEALPAGARVIHLQMPQMPESATEIRARAGRHEGIAHLVPPPVASYIASHSLYEDR